MKKVKVTIIMVLIFVLAFSTTALTNALHGYFKDFQIVKVDVNGKIYDGDIPAILFHGNTFVPLRFVAETLGAKVEWSDVQQTAVVMGEYDAGEDNNDVNRPNITISPEPRPTYIIRTEEEIESLKEESIPKEFEGMINKDYKIPDREYDLKHFMWITVETDYYTLHYSPGFSDDALKMYGFLNKAVDATLEEFKKYPEIETLLKDKRMNVFMLPEPTGWAHEGRWNTNSGNVGDYEFLNLRILAFSAYRENRIGTFNEIPMGDDHFLQTTIHEYISPAIKYLTEQRQQGWNIYSSQVWYHQGQESYLGAKYGNPNALTVYIDTVSKNPDRIAIEGDRIFVENPYIDGTVLVHFMYDTFGKEKMHALLLSEEETFEEAVEKELAPWDELEPMFKEWLDKQ
jgi:hypothetical protein